MIREQKGQFYAALIRRMGGISQEARVKERKVGSRGTARLVMAVTLHTTHGDLKLEVFCDLVPTNCKLQR